MFINVLANSIIGRLLATVYSPTAVLVQVNVAPVLLYISVTTGSDVPCWTNLAVYDVYPNCTELAKSATD